jgi:hypothetical protein
MTRSLDFIFERVDEEDGEAAYRPFRKSAR